MFLTEDTVNPSAAALAATIGTSIIMASSCFLQRKQQLLRHWREFLVGVAREGECHASVARWRATGGRLTSSAASSHQHHSSEEKAIQPLFM